MQFKEKWNILRVIGAIDGKHIRMECPKLTGSQYFDYKGFFSMVLVAMSDVNYCCIFFNLSQYGSTNNSSVLLNLHMVKCLKKIV